MNYGQQFEAYVASQLRQQGFQGVHLTPKTGDFGADILCFDRFGQPCAVQCKYLSRFAGYKAVEETLAGAKYYQCKRALLVTNCGFTRNAKEGAKKLDVELYVVQVG